MLLNTQYEEYPVISAGCDWLTGTGKNGSPALSLEAIADSERSEANRNGVRESPQVLMGFEGYKLEGLFFGRREHDVMMRLSGATAERLATTVIPHCSNVSRLDLQVTLFTQGAVLTLAQDTYSLLESGPHTVGRPRNFSITVNHGGGETCNINSRSSDNFGRIYDKGVEAKLGPAGLLWRYEVELKRDVAKRTSQELARHERPGAYACDVVRQWMLKRGVGPPWPAADSHFTSGGSCERPTTDVLNWFKLSLSKTIATQIEKHGLEVVLESLNLQKYFQPKGTKHNANL